MQLCINAQIPSYAGGTGGTAIYVGEDIAASHAIYMPLLEDLSLD